MFKKFILSITAISSILCACSERGGEEDDVIISTVNGFAIAYFNYDFQEALSYVTPESVKWLRFAASNVLDSEVEILKTQRERTTHDVGEITYTSDTTAVVECKVCNVLVRDTFGCPGRIVNETSFSLNVVKYNGQWRVRMEDLPRSEKQSLG